jgi:hypothetical protein
MQANETKIELHSLGYGLIKLLMKAGKEFFITLVILPSSLLMVKELPAFVSLATLIKSLFLKVIF